MSVLDELKSASKRPRVHDAQMAIKLPASVKALLREEARRVESSESDVLRTALAEYFERRGIGQ